MEAPCRREVSGFMPTSSNSLMVASDPLEHQLPQTFGQAEKELVQVNVLPGCIAKPFAYLLFQVPAPASQLAIPLTLSWRIQPLAGQVMIMESQPMEHIFTRFAMLLDIKSGR
jgi:hypothetical protein